MKNKYTDDSIISLNPREFTRLRPATYLGSNEYSTQLVREVFSNALDEHIIGHGNIIWVEANLVDNIYKVKDEGQGFPINVVRDDGETVLQAAFDKFNTSGKYDDNGVYSGSVLGLNGIGSKLTNFLSTKLSVSSSNGFTSEHLVFIDGIFKDREVRKEIDGKSGTEVIWSPDSQFFQNKDANIPDLKKLFEDLAALCPDLTIHFKVISGTEKNTHVDIFTYHSTNGIQDLVDAKTKGKEIISNRFVACKKDGPELFDITLTYTSDYSENVIAYANYGLTESGVHISTVKAGLTRQINRYATDNNLLKKNDDPLTQNELSEGFYLVFNVKASRIKYDSQTKTRIVDLNKTLINSVINNDFYDWLNNNPKDAKIIVEKALLARKAKEAAQKAKDIARGLKQKKSDKFLNLPTKLVDANPRDRDRSKCILYLVEGDSAANGLISKRNGEIHGIMPLRGKILSVRKASVADMYKNQEISNIVSALGLDVNPSDYTLKYDIKKLRYHKIVLLEDGDPDGGHIRLLLITLLWRLCPELLQNGHVYTSRPPLYKITNSKNQYCYLATERDLELYKKKHSKEKFIVNRIKGLGELSPDELFECMIKDGTETVLQLDAPNYEDTEQELEKFMGSEVLPRREYYNKHFSDIRIDIE
jgi:DNA gyrase subunit B